MESTRTVYRCVYAFKYQFEDGTMFGPVRDSKAFRTEPEARKHADELRASGYSVVVWRERQVKTRRRWETDLDHESTQPLDP